MKRKIFLIVGIVLMACVFLLLVGGTLFYRKFFVKTASSQAIDNVIDTHHEEMEVKYEPADPFGEDGIVHVLFIGLDNRAGEAEGHCDAIQMITIDKNNKKVNIVAVPRGTYAPLPPGVGKVPSDYYVSNSCGLVGLKYGIDQIEKILGQRADFIVTVGFSETIGILRNLKLPTIKTLQWLRQRQVYAIGEPQRARDHSTFIKYLLINYISDENSKIDNFLQYIIYKMVNTDLSFADTQAIREILIAMDLSNHPDRIILSMKPSFEVQDIQYSLDKLGVYDPTMTGISKEDYEKMKYSDNTVAEAQAKIFETIESKKDDNEFTAWAYKSNFWLQIEDDAKRLETQYYFLEKYAPLIADNDERKQIVADYILEMKSQGFSLWEQKGNDIFLKINE